MAFPDSSSVLDKFQSARRSLATTVELSVATRGMHEETSCCAPKASISPAACSAQHLGPSLVTRGGACTASSNM